VKKPFYISNALVLDAWRRGPNWLEVPGENPEGPVYIYFSSNGIYFPNTEEVFLEKIGKQDRYEFLKSRCPDASLHVFVRDVHKQWYVRGVSREMPTFNSVIEFLDLRYKGRDLVTVGVSAGGVAAIVAGVKLSAIRAIAICPQLHLLQTARKKGWRGYEYVRELAEFNQFEPLLNAAAIILSSPKTKVTYIASVNSEEDESDIEIAKGLQNVNCILVQNSVHGVPFIPTIMSEFLQLENQKLLDDYCSLRVWNQHQLGWRLLKWRYSRHMICQCVYLVRLKAKLAYRKLKAVFIG